MRKITLGAGIACAGLAFAPLAGADPTAGHDAKVHIQTPPMLCEIGSDDADPGIGPNVICQGSSSEPGRATIRPSSPRQASSATGVRTSAPVTTMPLLTPSSPARPTTSRAGRSWRAVTAFASPTTALGTACSSAAIPPSIRSDS
jgi:hypothetical protein